MSIRGVVCFLAFFATLANGQSNNCAMNGQCWKCIQEIDCVWCITPIGAATATANEAVGRCRSRNETGWCASGLIDPKSTFEIEDDLGFSDKEEETIQLKPQRVKLSLRKGEKRTVQFKFQNAANYPVDLYYLMDLSNSMLEHKKTLGQIGEKLAATMRKITSKFRLGFGSFIDKVDLPFASTVPERLKSPCGSGAKACASPYSFKNVLPLTNDTKKFVSEVIAAEVSGNLDSPEGGLDAMMQAIVCKEKINWRDQARHLLIFSTDAQYHIAGDGKLAGVIEPNPAKCYENDSDFLKYDYPSVSHVNYVAKQNNINIIFAIAKKDNSQIKSSYQALSENIENSKFGELVGDNVVKLIVDNYNKIAQSIKFTSNASSDIDVQFASNCSGKTIQTNRCSDVRVGQVIDFSATIELRQCPKDGQKSKIISIRPEGLNESLIIELEFLCDCDCKSDTTFEEHSSRCANAGSLACGVCDCDPGRFGNQCQCDSNYNKSENETVCNTPGTNEKCSGNGQCNCDKCECYAGYSGQYCDCDDFSCKRENGLLCSGHGECKCSKCVCNAGYTGEACGCEMSDDTCRPPYNLDSVCSGNGVCECGKCSCQMKDNQRYSGKYCEECTSCPPRRCEELFPCVQCRVLSTPCEDKCDNYTIETFPKLEYNDEYDYKKCKIPDNHKCYIHFDYYYNYNDNKLGVRAMTKKVCPEEVNIVAWIIGVIAVILVIGLITLIVWKILTTLHDRREYAKFENERKKSKWGTTDNPLYNDPNSTFQNPAYKRGSVRFSLRKN